MPRPAERRGSGETRDAARLAARLQDTPLLLAEVVSRATTLSQLEQALVPFGAALEKRMPCDQVEVWLHDRNTHQLRRIGSDLQVRADDTRSPLGRALRRTKTDVRASSDTAAITILTPIRGRRRALGVLRFSGVRTSPGERRALATSLDRIAWQTAAIIEHVQLLAEVLRARRELESTFAALQDLVVVCDASMAILDVNEAFSKRVARPRDTLVGQRLDAWMAPDTVRWVSSLRPKPGESIRTEVVDARLGGTFSLTVSGRETPDAGPLGLVVVARDVTAERALEEEQQRLRQQLAHSEKLAALGQFVAGIAHEINNPLQGIIGHVELIRAEAHLSRQTRRDLRLVEREAERAAQIVRDLLVFARARSLGNRKPLQVVTVLKRVLSLRSRACRAAGIRVVRKLPAALPKVAGEGSLLQQAFLNIVLNAEQAMAAQGGGRLYVRAWKPDGRRVAVEIRDTGPGIPEAALPRIFEPFFTTKPVGQGTGLGLALTYGIIREHGGEISVTKYPSGGAVFTVYLPAFDPSALSTNMGHTG